jgi:hypothetical protein
MSDTYILQREMIFPRVTIPVGTEYTAYKTGRSFVTYIKGNPHYISNSTIKSYPNWFKLKEEKCDIEFSYYGSGWNYKINYNKPIDKEDFPKIALAIERALKSEYLIEREIPISLPTQQPSEQEKDKRYTEKDLEKAFKASRELWTPFEQTQRYSDFDDYKEKLHNKLNTNK